MDHTGHLGESTVDMTTQSWPCWREGGEWRVEPGAEVRKSKVQKGKGNQNVWVI